MNYLNAEVMKKSCFISEEFTKLKNDYMSSFEGRKKPRN